MTDQAVPGQADGAQEIRAGLRRGLTAALKARDADAVAALRTAIAAIDNAEAVPAPDAKTSATSVHVAGASSEIGSTEAARRQLSASEVRDILNGQVAEHAREAGRYDALGQTDPAERLRRQAHTLSAYLK